MARKVTPRPPPPVGPAAATADGALLAAFLAVVFLLGCFDLWDYDVWWHLRTGQLIWQRGAVPRADWFTYTSPGVPWVDLHWGYQLIVAGLYAVGGVPLLVLAKAATGVAIVAAALLGARPRGAPLALTVAVWLVPVVVLTGRLYERPEALTLLYLALFLAVVYRAAAMPWLLWILPALQLLWVNTHGLFVLGPVVLAALWADRAVAAAVPAVAFTPPSGPGTRFPAPAALAGPTLAVLAACFVNPYGARGTLFPLELFRKINGQDDFYRRAIGELQGVGDFLSRFGPFANIYLTLFLATLLIGAASFAAPLRRGQVSPFRVVLFVAFSYLGWQAKRNSNLFALVLATVAAWNLGESWPASSPAGARRLRGARAAVGVLVGLLGILVVSNGLYDIAREGRRFGIGERPRWFAHESAQFLTRPGMPDHVLCLDLGQAAVAIFHAGPERKVFIDPRLEVNPRAALERYLAILRGIASGRPDWVSLLGPGGAADWPAILAQRDRPYAAVLARDPRWRAVHADAIAVVFLPVARAERLGLPAVRVDAP